MTILLLISAACADAEDGGRQPDASHFNPLNELGPQAGRQQAADDLPVFDAGLLESENQDGKQFGINGITKALEEAADGPVDEMLNSIYSSFEKRVSGKKLKDDLTIILLKKK